MAINCLPKELDRMEAISISRDYFDFFLGQNIIEFISGSLRDSRSPIPMTQDSFNHFGKSNALTLSLLLKGGHIRYGVDDELLRKMNLTASNKLLRHNSTKEDSIGFQHLNNFTLSNKLYASMKYKNEILVAPIEIQETFYAGFRTGMSSSRLGHSQEVNLEQNFLQLAMEECQLLKENDQEGGSSSGSSSDDDA